METASTNTNKIIHKLLKQIIMLVDISKLKLNSLHKTIYQIKDIQDLMDSISDVGLLEKIVVDQNLTIISGVRRYTALKNLGFTSTDVEIKNVNQNDVLLNVISFNKYRVKTNRELLAEAKYLKQIWGQRQGRKSSTVLASNPANAVKVNTRTKVCKTLRMSAGNLEKLEYIDKVKPELIAEIDKGNATINQAFNVLKKKEKETESIKIQNLPAQTISTDYYKIFNKSSDDLSDVADETVQTIFTSPPYWKKRNYSENIDELGAEKTSKEFVKRLANHINQCKRVLKKEGSLFLNMGDTYEDKSLALVPHRLVIELLDEGWILRNTIIWKKTNYLPSASKDNLTPSYEYIFHLVKNRKYLYNQLMIPTKDTKLKVNTIHQKGQNANYSVFKCPSISGLTNEKNLSDFWTEDIVETATANQAVVKQYGTLDHPAPFPVDITILPILATSNPGDIVMDIFSGSGTVGEVALKLGRKFIGFELNPNFNELQTGRFEDALSKREQEEKLDNAISLFNEASELSQAA